MLEHFKGEEVFVKKVLEYKDQALFKQRLILTKFLNPYHQEIIKSVIPHDELQVKTNGGFINSESQRVIIAPNFYELEEDDFKIGIVKIKYPSHFETIRHNDVLGALMSLGVERELFGDIVKKDDDFYIAIDINMFPFIKENLTQIKRSKVNISLCDEKIAVQNEFRKKTFIVSSFRLDKIISTLFGIPRTKATKYIQSGFVRVNHKDIDEINYLCNNNDIISFKKHGRVKLIDCNRKTRSDNNVIEGHFYK